MKKNKKVVIISPAHPYRGGQAIDEAYLYKMLSDANYDTSTITFTTLYPSMLFPGKTQYEHSKNILFDHQSKIQRVINSINPITWIKTFKILYKLKPNAVIFIWWTPFLGPCYGFIIALMKCFIKKTKIVFLVDNFLSHEKTPLGKILVNIAFASVDAFVCQSEFIYKQVKKQYPKRDIFKTTLSIYGDFDNKNIPYSQAKQKLNINDKCKVILFFGIIREYKGLDNLIKAFSHFLKKHPNSKLLVAGECYEKENKYTQLIKDLGITKNVIFHNQFIPNENIGLYFSACDTVCLPYISGTQSGIMMLAIGHKKPVVVTNVGGVSELVINNKTGIIIDKSTPESISQGLDDAFKKINPTRFEQDINSVIQKIKHRKIDKILETIIDA